MSSRYPPSLPMTRGPLSLYEMRAFNRFLSRPKTLHSFAALGADAAMNYLDVRNALGVVLPPTTRRGWIWRLADVGPVLAAAGNPHPPVGQTDDEAARWFARMERVLDAFEVFDATRVRPYLPTAPAGGHPFDPSQHPRDRPAAGNVVALATRRPRSTPDDEGGPQGGAPLGAA